ncbi:hypothetical protein C492_02697 [Natronococcus jeotgali DSM 18795]|uniref:CopG family transcriptional regulator n=1 Tax=Natronococcus jeotgali DSM 18795 TaxID=1227498 RepID=L9XZ28_9EURY|nr:hypothetical protein C492_02697 [Natronococcus jeotgali DSM 18795]
MRAPDLFDRGDRPFDRRSLMSHTLEISDDLKDRLDSHCDEGQSPEELIEELVSIYETEGTFMQEGYSE